MSAPVVTVPYATLRILARTGKPVRTAELAEGPLTGGPPLSSPEQGKVRRGTSNGNDRGNSEDRRRRRLWLVETYRADQDVMEIHLHHGPVVIGVDTGTEGAIAACRCYRCGLLLTMDTVTVDRIKPGCRGGTYRRENIRPACGPCNSETGGALAKRPQAGGDRQEVPPERETPARGT